MANSHAASIRVDADPETLFEIIMDLECYPDWADGVRRVDVLERDADDRPVRAEFEIDAMIKRLVYVLVYDYEYPNRVTWDIEPGSEMTVNSGEYLFVRDGDATEVQYRLELDVAFKVPSFMVRTAQKTIQQTALKKLKELAEGDGAKA